MIERVVHIPTSSHPMDVFICHPDGPGPFPVVIFYMDAPGIREELYDMCRRIGSAGYYVALPDLYYRHGAASRLSTEATDENSPEFRRMFALMGSLSNDGVVADTAQLLQYLSAETFADAERIAAIGYCMSGPFVLCAAAAWPQRVRAAIAFFGVGMVSEAPDSPHLRVQTAAAEIYAGFAEDDVYAPASQIPALREQTDAAGLTARYDVFPGTGHGFCFPGRPTYDAEAASKHWETLFDICRRTLEHGHAAGG